MQGTKGTLDLAQNSLKVNKKWSRFNEIKLFWSKSNFKFLSRRDGKCRFEFHDISKYENVQYLQNNNFVGAWYCPMMGVMKHNS